MNFRFPVIVIDEDFRSENISGSGIRDLAQAISSHGFEVVGYTSYVDLSAFAQQASRASCFILSIDDEELRFRSAVVQLAQMFETIGKDPKTGLTVEDRALFDAYAMMVRSDEMVETTVRRIRQGNWAPGALRDTIEEHVFCSTKANALGTKLSCPVGISGIVCVGPDSQHANLV